MENAIRKWALSYDHAFYISALCATIKLLFWIAKKCANGIVQRSLNATFSLLKIYYKIIKSVLKIPKLCT